MSFYETSITHPRVESTSSGVVVVGTSWSHLSSQNIAVPTGVWIRNDDDAISISVKSPSSSAGITQAAGEDRFYPVSYLHEIQISADSGTVSVTWWLG